MSASIYTCMSTYPSFPVRLANLCAIHWHIVACWTRRSRGGFKTRDRRPHCCCSLGDGPLCSLQYAAVDCVVVYPRYDDRAAMIRRQDEELDAEQLEAYVQQRFGNQRDAAADFGDGGEAGP